MEGGYLKMNQQSKNVADKVVQALSMAADYLQAFTVEVNRTEAQLLQRIQELEAKEAPKESEEK